MALVSDPDRPRRRRRTPEEARAEILAAASELLTDRRSELTVAAIMERTTLSRKSFYVHFRDRAELMTCLVAPLRRGADEALERWRTADDPIVAGRAALRSAAHAYRLHGAVLRALASAAERDPEIAVAWAGFVDPVVDLGTRTITDAVAAGTSTGLDPGRTARALVTMNVHCLLGLEPDASDAELEALVTTLAAVWERTIYATTA
ncbi:TetR family transcriptional regulator [Patulibacter sp. NPDC049589]|uniref:TetR/AcrR family transcriptional regulator n=1 Tax=Patulibacter sp. NPDC049589 TaxID=3154731 RepID=UPI0034219468